MTKDFIKAIDQTKSEVDKIKTALASVDKKYQESKSNSISPAAPDDKTANFYKELDYRIGYVYDSISAVRDMVYKTQDMMFNYIYEHQKNHLPPIKSNAQMENVLKALGLDNEYQVVKPMISVAKVNGDKIISVDFTKK